MYLLLLSLLAADKPAVTVVTLGDSITRGVRQGVKPEETFSSLLAAGLKEKGVAAEVVNAGVGGERTDGALKRLEKDVLARKPKVVVIMYGTNDSYVDKGAKEVRVSEADFRRNLREMIERLRKSGVEPILMTEPRWAPGEKDGAGNDPNVQLDRYMDVCRQLSREFKTPLVDNFVHWTEAEKKGTKIREWTTDGYHPNPAGHREIAKVLLPVVLEALKRP